MTNNKILFLLDNVFTNDRRVHREAATLIEFGYSVTLIAVFDKMLPVFEKIDGISVHRIFENDIYDVKKIKIINQYALKIISEFSFDIVHAHDQIMLNLGVAIKNKKPKIKLIYDSHELFRAWPLNTQAKGWIFLKSMVVRYLLKKREAKNIKFIDALITVNESINTDILAHFKLKIPSVFVRNIPEFTSIVEPSNILRDKFNISKDDKILVYIGANIYPRTINIEQVISEFANIDGVKMVFICKDNWGRSEVKKYADGIGVKNLYFHDIVPVLEIPKYLSSADVGIVSSWNKKDLSYWYGLDNKLFEYMMSEIPIVATRQPEYIGVIEKYNIGLCINPETDSYFRAFETIIKNYADYKENLFLAKKILNWEQESKKLIEFYRENFK